MNRDKITSEATQLPSAQVSQPSTADLLAPLPPSEPVDEVRYERNDHGDTETMTLRAGRLFVKWPYTLIDCYSIDYVKRSLFAAAEPVRYLDPAKLEQKRLEMFRYAHEELLRASLDAPA